MASPKKDLFEPLIKPVASSTLRDKQVEIKDTMNFERTQVEIPVVKKEEEKQRKSAVEEKLQKRKTTMKTQKMSLDVLTKLDILEPFMRGAEMMEDQKKLSINDKIDILLESYIHAKLTSRQLEGFNAIYQTYLEE